MHTHEAYVPNCMIVLPVGSLHARLADQADSDELSNNKVWRKGEYLLFVTCLVHLKDGAFVEVLIGAISDLDLDLSCWIEERLRLEPRSEGRHDDSMD